MPKVVAILSCRYSGSTMLDFMLGAHSQGLSLTELRAFIVGGRSPFTCKVCDPPESCPIWTPAFTEHLRGISPSPRLYDAIAQHTGAQVLVDSSKIIPGWFEHTLPGIDPQNLLCVLITKSPEEYAGSERNKMGKNNPHSIPKIADLWWSTNNEILDFVDALACQKIAIRYRDLVQHPQAVLTHVLGQLGLDYEPGIEHFWNFQHHPLWGNPGTRAHVVTDDINAHAWYGESHLNQMLYRQSHRTLYLDEKWKKSLSASDVDALYSDRWTRQTAELLGYTHPREEHTASETGWTPRPVFGTPALAAMQRARRRDITTWKPVRRLRLYGPGWIVRTARNRLSRRHSSV